MKKAFFVTANVTARVIVDVKVGENNLDDYEKIIQQAKNELIANLTNDYKNQIDDVIEDKSVPCNHVVEEICPIYW